MSYKQLTTYDRGRIEVLINEGESLRSIAQKLNVSPSTISRELKRNRSAEGYLAEVAHKKYEKRKQQCGRKIKASPQIVKKVQDESLIESLELINHRPRKCLDWNSTHEAFMNEVLHLI